MRSPRAGLRVPITVLALLLAVGLPAAVLSTRSGARAAPTVRSTSGPATPTGSGTTTVGSTAPSTTTVTRTVTPSATGTPTATRTVTSTQIVSAPAATAGTGTVTATATVTKAPSRSGSQTSGAAIAIAIAVLVLAAAGLGYFLVRRGRSGVHSSEPEWDAELTRLQRTARWLAGQAGYLTEAPTRAESDRRWGDAHPIVVDLERSLVEAEQAAPDRARAGRAGALALAVAGLRSAIESDLRVRATADDAPESDDRAEEAARRVRESRQRLDDALSTPPPVTPGAAPN